MIKGTCNEQECDSPILARGMCSAHYGRAWRAGTLPPIVGRHYLSEVNKEERTAVCSICGPTEIRVGGDTRGRECGTARKERSRLRGRGKPRSDKNQWRYWLRFKYGLEVEDWHAMILAQSGRCGICSAPLENPCIDHDHLTGRVRGLLCRPCNIGLGFLRDCPDRMGAAISYVAPPA